MSSPRELYAGDATFAKSFTKISRGDNGEQLRAGFNPPKGREFVVLLLGDVEKGQSWVDVEKMLNGLGFCRNDTASSHRIPAGLYRELAALRELRDAISAYADKYMRDEIEDDDSCPPAQHDAAVTVAQLLGDAKDAYWPGSHEGESE